MTFGWRAVVPFLFCNNGASSRARVCTFEKKRKEGQTKSRSITYDKLTCTKSSPYVGRLTHLLFVFLCTLNCSLLLLLLLSVYNYKPRRGGVYVKEAAKRRSESNDGWMSLLLYLPCAAWLPSRSACSLSFFLLALLGSDRYRCDRAWAMPRKGRRGRRVPPAC